jgi:hypothetical protein
MGFAISLVLAAWGSRMTQTQPQSNSMVTSDEDEDSGIEDKDSSKEDEEAQQEEVPPVEKKQTAITSFFAAPKKKCLGDQPKKVAAIPVELLGSNLQDPEVLDTRRT